MNRLNLSQESVNLAKQELQQTGYNLYLRTFLIERSYWTLFMLVHFKPQSHINEIVKWYYY